MAAITQTCTKCGKQFLVIDAEQQFLAERGIPNPTICPTDRQARRLELRGKRELFKTKCSQCGKDIVVSYDPAGVKTSILCKEDYEKYFEQNDPLINEPLPGDTATTAAAPPTAEQPTPPQQQQMGPPQPGSNATDDQNQNPQ